MEETKKMYFESYVINKVEDGLDGMKRVNIQTGEELNDNVTFDIPEWELVACMTDKPSDATTTRNTRANIIVDEIYALLKEKNVRLEDVGFINQKLISKISGNEEEAANRAAGVSNRYEIRINHIEK